MKTIPYLPAGLLLLFCLVNLYMGIFIKPEHNLIVCTVFGIIYLTLLLIVIRKIRLAPWLGFIIPFAVLFIYPVLVDFNHLKPWSSGAMGAIDGTIVLYFLYQLLLKV